MKLFLNIVLFSFVFLIQMTIGQSWMPVNNPEGGSILDITIHSTGEIFAATSKGPFSSSDGGQNWISRRGNELPLAATTIQVNSSGHLFWQLGFLLNLSTDGGVTWQDINNGRWTNGGAVVINTSDDIFVATNTQYVWRSTDNGSSWTQLTGIPGARSLGINSQQHLFAGRSGKIYRSIDNGDNWEIVYTDSSSSNTVLKFAFNGSNNIYGVIWSKGVIKSTDGGNSWNYVNNGLPLDYTNTITANSSNDIFVGKALSDGIGGGVYRSTDGGNSWTEFSSGLINSSVRSLAVSFNGDLFAGTSVGGIFSRSSAGSNWIQSNNGLNSISLNILRARADGTLFAGTTSGVYYSKDGAASWTQSINGLVDLDIETLGIHPNGDVYCGDGEKIYRSTDDGNFWSNVTSNLPGGEVEVQGITFNSAGDVFLATAESGVIRSTDNGQSWSFINNGLPDLDVRTLATNSNDVLFASNGVSVYRSTDDGENWVEINNGLTDTDIVEFAIGQNDVLLGATYSDGIFRSTNNGNDWTLSLDTDISYMAVNGPEIYAGSEVIVGGGVFRSVDNGLTWTPMNDNLPSLQINSLAYRPGDRLFAEVRSNGLYAINLTTDVKNINNEIPDEFNLVQNYPNPFNPTTKISYSIPSVETHGHASVQLVVYDILGRVIATLVNKQQKAGYYEVQFNASGLSSGVYFYKLLAGSFMQTKKMLLLR